MKKYRFLILLFLAIGTRMLNINQPILEGPSTRQIENAMIARNFYQDGFRLLYPYLSDEGDKKSYQLVEFQLLPYLASLIYFFLGGVHEFVLRFISVVFFGLACIYLYRLMRLLFNEEIAFYASIVFSFSPLSVYLGRAFQYEMAMIFFILTSVFYFYRWFDSHKLLHLLVSAACYTLAVLLKIPNLYMLLVFFFIGFSKYRYKLLRMKELYIFLGIVFIVSILWYRHAANVMINNLSKYSPYYTDNIHYMIKSFKLHILRKDFYKINFDNLVTYTLTPIGFSLAIIGFLLLDIRKNISRILLIWLICILGFFIMVPAQATQGYYQIHFLPIFSVAIATAWLALRNIFAKERYKYHNRVVRLTSTAVILIVVLRYTYAYYHVPPNFRNIVETGRAVDRLTAKDALVVASIENGLDLLYYCNRKGWPFMVNLEQKREGHIAEGLDVSKIIYDPVIYFEKLRAEGAGYFASASLREFFSHHHFSEYMLKNYPVIERSEKYIIFDVKKKK